MLSVSLRRLFFAVFGLAVFAGPSRADPHNPDDPLYTPVREDGDRCRDLAIAGGQAACDQANRDAKASGCQGLDDTVLQILHDKGLTAGCQFARGRLSFAYSCLCGCFHPDTEIDVVAEGSDSVSQVRAAEVGLAKNAFSLWSLTRGSTLDALTYTPSPIQKATRGPAGQPLVRIVTEDGRQLRVTTEHAILLASGEMVEAQSIKAGNTLVTRDGVQVRVTSAEQYAFGGEVFNFSTSGNSGSEHVIVADGLLVGDLTWQNELKGQIGSVVIRN